MSSTRSWFLVAVAAGLVGCTQPAASTSTVAPVPTVFAAWAPAARAKTAACVIQGGLPDSGCTPGATDPRVNQADIGSTICRRGYTESVRPPLAVTEKIKRDQMAAYGLRGVPLAEYELDHLIALELGGAPQDVANLWPEPRTGDANAHMKDAVETYLNREVCRGALALTEAQREIATDWLAVYKAKGLSPAP